VIAVIELNRFAIAFNADAGFSQRVYPCSAFVAPSMVRLSLFASLTTSHLAKTSVQRIVQRRVATIVPPIYFARLTIQVIK